MEQKFYICEHCGKIITVVKESGVPVICCGEKMKEIIPGTTEAATEKHIPVVTVENGTLTVAVGEQEHPMEKDHYIEWVALQTKQGNQIKMLTPESKPQVCFAVCDGDKAEAVYAYCNKHGLWKSEIEEKAVCDLKPADTETNENYTVCKCNNVSYFDILDEVHKHSNINDLLEVFEDVKTTTHCSTGCGGCYNKVISIISSAIMDGERN